MRTTNNSISPNMLPIPPTSSSSSDKGSRGKSKKPNFRLDPDGNKTTYMLELDLSDTQVRDRVEKHENTAFALKCALQRDARARIKAYNAAKKERKLDPKALRIRLGLTKKGLEKAARNHIINSKWMRHHITQALGQTTDSRSASQAKQARALSVAMLIVLLHGSNLTIEDCDIRTWTRRWGKSIMLFSPGMLITALKTECERNGGRLIRASTYTTAMSQHCLCGMRVSKALNDRKHVCPNCGLSGDRDLVSAALAACTILSNVNDPRTARVDYELAEHMRVQLAVQQEVPIRSTSNSLPLPHGEKGGSRSRDSENRISSPVKFEMDSLTPEQGPCKRKRRRNRPKTPKIVSNTS